MKPETSLLSVIRGYLPLLIGIAVAVVNLHATHTADAAAHALEVPRLAPEPKVVRMGTIVVTAKRLAPEPKVVRMETIVVTARREGPMTASYAANAR